MSFLTLSCTVVAPALSLTIRNSVISLLPPEDVAYPGSFLDPLRQRHTASLANNQTLEAQFLGIWLGKSTIETTQIYHGI